MRKFIKRLVVFSLVSWVVGWGLVGFIKSDLTGGNWTGSDRLSLVLAWIVVEALLLITIGLFTDEEDEV